MSSKPSTWDRVNELIADESNSERYVDFSEARLGIVPAATQQRILRAISNHRYVQIQSANGVGKTFAIAIAKLAFLYANTEPAICYTTSGTYDTLDDTLWKPMKAMYDNALIDLPGRAKDNPPRIENIPGRPESYFKARSPRHAGSLEGRHGARMFVSVEEADKPDIDMDIIHSMETNVTDKNDRMVVIGNPPDDETGVMYDLRESEKYETIQFSAFESHNIVNEYEEDDDGYIGGLVAPSKIRERWSDYNGEEWPGLEAAATAHEDRDDLGKRWYKRVAGVIPPDGAEAHRPFTVADVKTSYDENATPAVPVRATGIDVARSGDRTAALSAHDDVLETHYCEQGANHKDQGAALKRHYRRHPDHPMSVDAVGEGSGLADDLDETFPAVYRFGNGSKAADEENYRYKWCEGLAYLGQWLEAGGTFSDSDLREELIVAARTVEFEQVHIASRGSHGSDLLQATPKDEVADALGHSPDLLDAAMMAVWTQRIFAPRYERVQDTDEDTDGDDPRRQRGGISGL